MPRPSRSGFQIGYSPAAEARLERLSGQRRRLLSRRLEAIAEAGPTWTGPTTVGVATRLDVARCEVRREERLVSVVAVAPRREVLRELVGEEIHRKWLDQEMSKLTHGRWY